MIVPMKKVAVITQAKDSLVTLNKLRSLGVLHVEHEQTPKGKNIALLHEEIGLLNQALGILSGIKIEPKNSPAHKEVPVGQVIARHIVDLYRHKEQLTEYLLTLSMRIKQYEEWGDFEPQSFRDLADNDIFAGLYQLPVQQLKQLGDDIAVSKLSVKGEIANCLLVSRKKIEVGLKEIPLPNMSLAETRKRIEKDNQAIQNIEEQLVEQLVYQAGLNKFKSGLEKELEFQEALAGMGQADTLVYISGYAPFDSVEKLVRLARQEQWALRIDEPGQGSNIPVLLRNPAWISIISPIFKFLEILPGYHELDISLPFLIFFSIFFGILIGDAGYGLVYFLITFLLMQKTRKHNKSSDGYSLFYILSLCAIIWGVCTGTFFGHEWVLKAGYKPLLPALNDEKALQRFCFFLGAVHLSIAHTWRAMIKSPSLSALADIGWICVLWASFFIARMFILGDAFPFFGKWLLICGITLVIFFTNPQKNILKGIAGGLGALALSLVNNFTDVVSYIRLFAVGLASVAIADAANAMAASAMSSNIFALLISVLIVLVGHTLGVVLGPVAVLVHGVRLNVLEFSGHINVSWSGRNYKPLKV